MTTREQILDIYNKGPEAVIEMVEAFVATIIELSKQNEALKDKVASLEKDSTNSHKPPSSDGLKKKRQYTPRGSSGKKPGGQKGHKGKTRTKVPPEQVSEFVPHKPEKCENCNAQFSEKNPTQAVERRQVWDIPPIEPFIVEHVFYQTECQCGHKTRLDVPNWIYSGIGERLQANIAYYTSEAQMTRRILKNVINDIYNTPIGLGTIQNRLENTSEILEPIYNELEDELPNQQVVNADESSYPHNNKLAWLWAFIASTFAFFTIQKSRGSKVIKNVLGKLYDGIIICDRFSAYVKYHKDRALGLIQFCWAHIIRDVKALKYNLAYSSNKPFSELMRQRIGALFRLWYKHKRGKITRQQLVELAEVEIQEMQTFLETNLNAPSKEVARFCKNLLKKWESLFTFIYYEGVEPTNNRAERLIRAGAKMRKISFCTRSKNGQLLLARLLSISQTCRMQNRKPIEFYLEAIHAYRNNLKHPSLINK